LRLDREAADGFETTSRNRRQSMNRQAGLEARTFALEKKLQGSSVSTVCESLALDARLDVRTLGL
jgi:hypothetical protein